VIKWYCPFARQAVFPSGHRYCINVYTGCAHGCVYCYAAGYEPEQAGAKRDFARRLALDLDDLERFDVPPAPVHISNSTDPFQPLEERLGHTKHALEGLLGHRHRFTSVTILTKNPSLAAREDYLALLRGLAEAPAGEVGVQVEVSVAFWRETARVFWDPGAPAVSDRLAGIRALRAAGIPVVLRIDPLFPRSPLPTRPQAALAGFGLAEAQTLGDLEALVAFGREVAARHVAYSPARIVRNRRGPMTPAMSGLLAVYRFLCNPGKPDWRGGSWRLPAAIAQAHVTGPFLALCERLGVPAKHCWQNLIETR
jgi:hypothetical protein